VSLAAAARSGVALPTLSVPASFGTTVGRPWLIPLLDLPVWARWASAVPALMSFVLLFMDQVISSVLCTLFYFGASRGTNSNCRLVEYHRTRRKQP
jgi:hypothetical protein